MIAHRNKMTHQDKQMGIGRNKEVRQNVSTQSDEWGGGCRDQEKKANPNTAFVTKTICKP